MAMVADTGMAASTVMAAATGMVETMVTVAMAMVETKGMEVATDMAVAKDMEETMVATRAMVAATGATKAMVAATEATRAMVAATEAARAMVATKGMTRTRATVVTKATEEIKDMANSLMAATKDTEGNRAVTTPRATAAGAKEEIQRTSTAGKPPDTLHDSSKNWLV